MVAVRSTFCKLGRFFFSSGPQVSVHACHCVHTLSGHNVMLLCWLLHAADPLEGKGLRE